MKASTEYRELEIIAPDLIRLRYADNAEVDLNAAKVDYKLYDEITQGKPFRKLIISGKFTQLSGEAIKYIQFENQKRAHLIIAEAIVTNSLAQRILGNFYYRLQRPNYNIRMFSSEEKAMKWLNSVQPNSVLTGKTA